MQTFADFALSIVMPPNPVRAIDNSLTTAQAAGKNYFLGCADNDSVSGKPATCTNGVPDGNGHFSDGVGFPGFGFACQGCHVLDPVQGLLRHRRRVELREPAADREDPAAAKPLRQGRHVRRARRAAAPTPRTTGPTGPQVRGSGFEHDGSVDTLFRFLQAQRLRRRHGLERRLRRRRSRAAQRRAVAPRLRQRSGAGGRAAGHLALGQRGGGGRAHRSPRDARAATPFVSKIVGASADGVRPGGARGGPGRRLRVVPPGERTGSFAAGDGGVGHERRGACARSATTPGQEVTFTCMPPGWLD